VSARRDTVYFALSFFLNADSIGARCSTVQSSLARAYASWRNRGKYLFLQGVKPGTVSIQFTLPGATTQKYGRNFSGLSFRYRATYLNIVAHSAWLGIYEVCAAKVGRHFPFRAARHSQTDTCTTGRRSLSINFEKNSKIALEFVGKLMIIAPNQSSFYARRQFFLKKCVAQFR